MPRVLIVDDERLLVKGLKRSLENEGFEVLAAYDGPGALALAESEDLDLIILDLMLPEINGFEVCRTIRMSRDTPIIMLTAKGDDVDRIVGLELGADDYLGKPFNTRELIARMRAVLRRTQPRPAAHRQDQTLRRGAMLVDPIRRRVWVNESEVECTAKEFDLLYLMAQHPGRVFSRDSLLDAVWGQDYFGDVRTVDVHIRRLREKLETDPKHPEWLHTKRGVGYYFREMS